MDSLTDHELLGDERTRLGRHDHKELISSLPREKGWRTTYIYRYQGFWYDPKLLQGTLACQQHFLAQNNDMFLVTNPKSGTTWLKALVYAAANRDRFAAAGDFHPLVTNNPHVLVPFLEYQLYASGAIPDLTAIPSPRLFASHIPFGSLPDSIRNAGCRIIYLCRNPKDVLISHWKFLNEIRTICMPGEPPIPLEEAFEMFCLGTSLYGPFWDHVLGYWQESLQRPERVLFLTFEDLKVDTKSQLKRLASFLGLPFSVEEERNGVVEEICELCSFEKLSNLEVNKTGKLDPAVPNNAVFFRKGEVGDWVNYLTPSMIERMDHLTQQKLNGTGLTF